MILKQKISCLVFLLVLLGLKVSAQNVGIDHQLLRARLINEDDHSSVFNARIINKNRVIGVYSDSIGIFFVPATVNDTLYITSLGFYPKEIKVTDSMFNQISTPLITLDERVYELKQVEINPFGTYEQFKYKILHLELPNDNTGEVIASIQRELKTIPHRPLQREASIPLGSPITLVYMLFSKEGKSLRLLKKAVENEKHFRIDDKKFNRDLVTRITGLNGELLNQFMLFCTPDPIFIEVATEYDVCKKITECYVDFKKDIMKVSINH